MNGWGIWYLQEIPVADERTAERTPLVLVDAQRSFGVFPTRV